MHNVKAIFDKREMKLNDSILQLSLGEECHVNFLINIPVDRKSQYDFSQLSIQSQTDDINPLLNDFIYEETNKLITKLEKYSKSPDIYAKLSSLYLELGEHERAIFYAEEATKLSNKEEFTIALSEIMLRSSKNDSALNILLSQNLTNDIYANLRIAYLLLQQNKIDEAKQQLIKCLKIDHLDFSTRLFLGTLSICSQEYETAIRHFRTAETVHYHSSSLHANKAFSFLSMKLYEKAKASSLIALSINENNFTALKILSESCQMLGDVSTPITYINRYLESNPDHAEAHAIIAKLYYVNYQFLGKKSLLQNAYKHLDIEYSLNKSEVSLNNLGIIFWKLQNHKLAETFFLKSISETSVKSNGYALYNLIGLYIHKKNFSEAYELSERFLKKYDQHNELWEDVNLQKVVSLEGLKKYKTSNALCLDLINKTTKANIKIDLYTKTIIYYSTISKEAEAASSLIKDSLAFLYRNNQIKQILKDRFLNNVAYSLLTFNQVDYASKILSKISTLTEDPYSIATLGMYHFRKGHINRGKHYYNIGISHVLDTKTKNKFRLKLALEHSFALYKANSYKKALRIIEKSSKLHDADEVISNDIQLLRNQIELLMLDLKHSK